MNITINFTGIEASEAVKQYATEKIEDLDKFFEGIISADVDVGMRSHHHNKGQVYYAEAKLQIPTRPNVYIVKEAEDLYKAIDKVKDHLKVELDRLKGKMHGVDKEALRAQKGYTGEE